MDPIKVGSFHGCASYPSRNSRNGGKTGVLTPAGTVSNVGKSTSVRSETGKGTLANDWVFLRHLSLRRSRISDSTTRVVDGHGAVDVGRTVGGGRATTSTAASSKAPTTRLRDQATSAPGASPRRPSGATSGKLGNGMPHSRARHASRSCGRSKKAIDTWLHMDVSRHGANIFANSRRGRGGASTGSAARGRSYPNRRGSPSSRGTP